MVIINNILVATDFGAASGVALAYGRDLARSYNARLHVLHVVEDVILRYTSEIGWVGADLQKDLEVSAGRTLNGLVTEDDRKTLNAEAIIEKGINPAETSPGMRMQMRSTSWQMHPAARREAPPDGHCLCSASSACAMPCADGARSRERDFNRADAATLAASV